MVVKGEPMCVAMDIRRHAHIATTTDVYAHVTPAACRGVANHVAEEMASHKSVVAVRLGYGVFKGVKTRERRGNVARPLSICLSSCGFSLAGEQGFEPQLPDPESGVLPLDDSPMHGAESSMRRKSCSTLSSHALAAVACSSSATCA